MMSYTEDGYVYVPDARAYSRGVCIGYVLAEDLGYPTAAAWLLGRA